MRQMRIAATCVGALLVMLISGGCGAIVGSGHVINESRKVRGFTGVELAGVGNVIVEQTETESLTVEAEDNLQLHLEAEVRDRWLYLGAGGNIQPTKPITWHVTVKDLRGLYLAGSGTISAPHVNTDSLQVVVAGSGTIRVAGTAEAQAAQIAGSGDYAAKDLESTRARIDMSGSGHAEISVSESLDADISGSGSIEYFGHPVVNEHVTGSGSIVSRS